MRALDSQSAVLDRPPVIVAPATDTQPQPDSRQEENMGTPKERPNCHHRPGSGMRFAV